jgi:hypothetical protein
MQYGIDTNNQTNTNKGENKMSEDTKYNGWTNYETWNWKLWMDNDEGSQNWMMEQAQEAYDNADETQYSTKLENAARNLADTLKEYAEENMPEITNSFYLDVLQAALSRVSWYEIAENLMENVDKEEEA